MPDTIMQSELPTFRTQSQDLAKLAEALSKAQKNFAPIPKDREVTVQTDKGKYKFKYATLDAIRTSTMPALSEQGLAVVQGMVTQGNGYAIETRLLHSSGEWVSNVTPMFVSGRVKDGRQYPPTNQELGSAQSYARRYGLSALICITADEDDDGNTADGNHIDGEREPYKAGPSGSARGGTQLRPERRQMPTQSSSHGRELAQQEPQLVDHNRPKGALPATKPAPAAGQTKEEQRAAKLKEATDKRISALKSVTGWTRATLDEFWAENEEWIGWMSDPANGALTEYQRFSDAFADAEVNMREIV
jgi:hypothetical protein